MRNQVITNDTGRLQTVWVFEGDDLQTRRAEHPSAVFSSFKAVSKWVKAHGLSGLITAYVLDVPAFEYSERIGTVPDHRRDGEHRQVWSGGEMHYHVKDGVVLGAPVPRRKRIAQLVAVPSRGRPYFNESSGTDNELTLVRAFLERIGFDEIGVLYDPAAAEVNTNWQEAVAGLKPGDLALFGFFGPGHTHGHEHCLLTKDTRNGLIPTLQNVLRFRDIERISDTCGAERVFLLNLCGDNCAVHSQEQCMPSPSAQDHPRGLELIRTTSDESGQKAVTLLPGRTGTAGQVTTIYGGGSSDQGSSKIPNLRQGLFTTAFLTVAQRRVREGLALQIDDDFMRECRAVVRGLSAEHELSSLPVLVRHGSEGHLPVLVEGRMPPPSMPEPEPSSQLSSPPRLSLVRASVGITRQSLNKFPAMKLAYIPPGRFMMGSPATEAGRERDETQHEVTLTKAFYLGTTPVTQEQWQALMGSNPSFFRGIDRLPVDSVSWSDAVEFCERLSETEGMHYRLPTEAEWEYACRAGTLTPFNTGMELVATQANYGILDYDGEPLAPHMRHTTPVGSYAPNAFGLYDMHGNVFEWCSDWYGEFSSGMATDPKGPEAGSERVIRGGSWGCRVTSLRSANRNSRPSKDRYRAIGFRIALDTDRSLAH